ncbi:MAG: hypothetical protein N3A57_07935 [Negativicutes bacterium]|nr:hypothetical protein [Negativicutes bacterium]
MAGHNRFFSGLKMGWLAVAILASVVVTVVLSGWLGGLALFFCLPLVFWRR